MTLQIPLYSSSSFDGPVEWLAYIYYTMIFHLQLVAKRLAAFRGAHRTFYLCVGSGISVNEHRVIGLH